MLFLKISSFDKSESFNSLAQGVLEIFCNVPPPPPALNRVKLSVFFFFWPSRKNDRAALNKRELVQFRDLPTCSSTGEDSDSGEHGYLFC